MNISDCTRVLPFQEIPDGGFIIFGVDEQTHFGIKVSASTLRDGSYYIATLKHPDVGAPGLWAYGVATGTIFLHLPDVTVRPKVALDKISLGWNRGPKAGMLLRTPTQLLLALHSNRSHVGVVDLDTGEYSHIAPTTNVFLFSAWQILLPGPDEHEILFEFASVSAT